MNDLATGLLPETTSNPLHPQTANQLSSEIDGVPTSNSKNSKRKTMHLSEFNQAFPPISNPIAPNENNITTMTHKQEPSRKQNFSYKETVQGFGSEMNFMSDISLDEIDLDSDEDDEDILDEDDAICYLSLMRKLQAKWSIKGKLTLTDLTCPYYIARFTSREDYEHVVTQGPWMIDDHYLTIRKWVPNFIPSEDSIKFLTAWVRIPNLPVEYFNEAFLRKVGSKVGKVIRVDRNTASAERGQFTRMSVEVDISKPLLSKFRLNGKIYPIQYEGLKMICFKCGKLGHNSEACHKGHELSEEARILGTEQLNSTENIANPNSLEAGLRPEEKDDFGNWMMVSKPQRKKSVQAQGKQGQTSGQSTTTRPIFNFANGPGKGETAIPKSNPISINNKSPVSSNNESTAPVSLLVNHHGPSHIVFTAQATTTTIPTPTTAVRNDTSHTDNIEVGMEAKETLAPYMGVMVPESPVMEVTFSSVQEDSSILQMEMAIPWNINQVLSLGTGNKNKINALEEVVRTYKPSIIALVETHMDGVHAIKIQKILGYTGHSRVDANGFSGGIWLYWKSEFVTVKPVKEHSQYITIEVSRNGEMPWFFSAVYASPNPSNRVELWTELEQYARINNHPWLLAGDFNETRSLAERHGGDQAIQSDHCPLLISPNGFAPLNSVQRPFRFQAAWMTHENFSEFIASNWDSNNNLVSQLSELSEKLQHWNGTVFGNIFRKKRVLMARIGGCQRELSQGRQGHLIKLEAKLRKELDEILEREEILWYQKSRVNFIKDGDRNTSYF
ncbi:uncharacterized protein LOC141612999 [Silene latifolia]|uniref:uncharacterized protein LOC141612999 n=1 Tax=Silene latifolia TaxID=37657 RepID=UPI003D7775B4